MECRLLLISGDNGLLSPAQSRPVRRWRLSIATLLLAIQLVLSELLCGCSMSPTIVGKPEVVSVDQEAETVTVTLALWRRVMRRLKNCEGKRKP